MRSTCVMFTINFHDEDTPLLGPEEWPKVTYCIYQLEAAPETGQLHYQGYMELSSTVRFNTLVTYDGLEHAHFERRRGSQAQAVAYCSKVETRLDGPWEYGIKKTQGKRADLDAVKHDLDAGMSMVDISNNHFDAWLKFKNSFKEYKRLRVARRDHAMEIIVIVGPSGTGKTRYCRDNFPNAYWKDQSKWWEDYAGEETVVVDEMYGHRFSFSFLLQLLDRYPLKVECKGSTYEFVSRRIVFTSNQEPEFWYSKEATHQVAWDDNPLNRRIRDFGRIIRTGAVHLPAPQAPLVAVATREFEELQQQEFYYGNPNSNINEN